jgi:hypothetical protein
MDGKPPATTRPRTLHVTDAEQNCPLPASPADAQAPTHPSFPPLPPTPSAPHGGLDPGQVRDTVQSLWLLRLLNTSLIPLNRAPPATIAATAGAAHVPDADRHRYVIALFPSPAAATYALRYNLIFLFAITQRGPTCMRIFYPPPAAASALPPTLMYQVAFRLTGNGITAHDITAVVRLLLSRLSATGPGSLHSLLNQYHRQPLLRPQPGYHRQPLLRPQPGYHWPPLPQFQPGPFASPHPPPALHRQPRTQPARGRLPQPRTAAA